MISPLRWRLAEGRVSLHTSKAPDAVLEMHSLSGELYNDFGPKIPEDKKRYEATLGNGKGKIELSSFSGNVMLRKR